MKTAFDIALKYVGKTPDESGKPTWGDIREQLAAEIKEYATHVVMDALDRRAIMGLGGEIVTP
jgi:hypothetical protein